MGAGSEAMKINVMMKCAVNRKLSGAGAGLKIIVLITKCLMSTTSGLIKYFITIPVELMRNSKNKRKKL